MDHHLFTIPYTVANGDGVHNHEACIVAKSCDAAIGWFKRRYRFDISSGRVQFNEATILCRPVDQILLELGDLL